MGTWVRTLLIPGDPDEVAVRSGPEDHGPDRVGRDAPDLRGVGIAVAARQPTQRRNRPML